MEQNLYSLLNELTAKSSTPVTPLQLEFDYERYCADHPYEMPIPAPVTARNQLRAFSKQAVKGLISVINLPLLNEMAAGLSEKVRKAEFDIREFAVPEDASYQEVQQALQKIYVQLQAAQEHKEEVNHFLTVLRTATNFINSLKKSLEAFLQDELVEPSAFNHLSERKRFAELVTTDLALYEQTFNNLRTTASSLVEEVLSSRINLLTRTDSAIRLLTRQQEQENSLNRMYSRGNTMPQAPTRDIGGKGPSGDDSGFDIQDATHG